MIRKKHTKAPLRTDRDTILLEGEHFGTGVEGVLARGLAAGQTLYRSMGNRLVTAAGAINPGSGVNGKPANLVARCQAGQAQVRGADRAIWRLSLID